jgi:predicted metal-dependent enzyme (double-stranded beta helix superfamily)
MLPAVKEFVDGVRGIYARIEDMEARLIAIRPLLQKLLVDSALNDASQNWPFRNNYEQGYVENLLFYEDPDYGFVLNSLMKLPGERTAVHDHAHTWTLYGVLRGSEQVVRFKRTDDGDSEDHAQLDPIGDHVVAPGYIDFVRPYEIHMERANKEPVVGVIFRSHRVGEFFQNFYDEKTGAIKKTKGPKQIPYELA